MVLFFRLNHWVLFRRIHYGGCSHRSWSFLMILVNALFDATKGDIPRSIPITGPSFDGSLGCAWMGTARIRSGKRIQIARSRKVKVVLEVRFNLKPRFLRRCLRGSMLAGFN